MMMDHTRALLNLISLATPCLPMMTPTHRHAHGILAGAHSDASLIQTGVQTVHLIHDIGYLPQKQIGARLVSQKDLI